MYEDGYRKLALLSENIEFAVGAKNIIKNGFIEEEGDVVADELYEQDSKDYRTQIAKIKASNPDVVFLLPQSDVSGGLAVKQIREMGLEIPIYSMIVFSGKDALDAAGDAANGVIFADAPGLSEDNFKAVEFLSKYKEKYGDPANEYLVGAKYDAVYLVANALNECGENTDCIKNYFYNLKEYNGVIGKYHFDKNGNVEGLRYIIKKVVDGKSEVVE